MIEAFVYPSFLGGLAIQTPVDEYIGYIRIPPAVRGRQANKTARGVRLCAISSLDLRGHLSYGGHRWYELSDLTKIIHLKRNMRSGSHDLCDMIRGKLQ